MVTISSNKWIVVCESYTIVQDPKSGTIFVPTNGGLSVYCGLPKRGDLKKIAKLGNTPVRLFTTKAKAEQSFRHTFDARLLEQGIARAIKVTEDLIEMPQPTPFSSKNLFLIPAKKWKSFKDNAKFLGFNEFNNEGYIYYAWGNGLDSVEVFDRNVRRWRQGKSQKMIDTLIGEGYITDTNEQG